MQSHVRTRIEDRRIAFSIYDCAASEAAISIPSEEAVVCLRGDSWFQSHRQVLPVDQISAGDMAPHNSKFPLGAVWYVLEEQVVSGTEL